VTEQFRVGPTAGQPAAYQLDDIDRQIVTLLLKDGRMSGAAVARAVGVSQRTVLYRIDKLLGCGVIQIGVVVEPHAIGLDVIADVFLDVSPGQIREVAERFAALQEVSFVAGSIGNGDLSIQVCLRDLGALRRFLEDVVGKMPGVTQARTVLVPWKFKDVHEWNIPPSSVDEGEVRPETEV
jgi:Lrp/AsnC family transcriptional regulator for asnA, asnC and gidA